MQKRAVLALVLGVFSASVALGSGRKAPEFSVEERLQWQWCQSPDRLFLEAEQRLKHRPALRENERWSWEVLQALSKPGAENREWAQARFESLQEGVADSASFAVLVWARAERWASEGNPERALVDFEDGQRRYAHLGREDLVHWMGIRAAACHRELGQWNEADQGFDAAIRALFGLGDTLSAVLGLEQQAQLHLRRGRYAVCSLTLDRAEASMRGVQGPSAEEVRTRLRLVRAEVSFWKADFRTALDELQRLGVSESNPTDPDWQSRWELLKGRMHRDLGGGPNRAKIHFRAAIRKAQERGAPRWTIPPTLEYARLFLAQGQADSAHRVLQGVQVSHFNAGMRGEQLQWTLLEAELALIRQDYVELRSHFQSEVLVDTAQLDAYEQLTRALGRINLVIRLVEIDPWNHPPVPPLLKPRTVYLKEAESVGRRTLIRLEQTEFRLERALLLERLSRVFSLLGEGDSAYAFLIRSNEMRSALLDADMGSDLEQMQIAIDLERSQSALTLEMAKAERARRRNGTLFIFSLLALAALIASWLAYRRIRVLSRQSDALLDNVLPKSIGVRLKTGQGALVEEVEQATLVFIDLVGFTAKSKSMSAEALRAFLEEFFGELDGMCSAFGLEKIKTIGDAYMAAAGVPISDPQHAVQAAEFALAVQENLLERGWSHRIGIDSGPLVAGVIGKHKFIYDLWGEVVNAAARMEQLAAPNTIRTTERFKSVLESHTDGFGFEPHDPVEVKGLGNMSTFSLSRSAKSKALGG